MSNILIASPNVNLAYGMIPTPNEVYHFSRILSVKQRMLVRGIRAIAYNLTKGKDLSKKYSSFLYEIPFSVLAEHSTLKTKEIVKMLSPGSDLFNSLLIVECEIDQKRECVILKLSDFLFVDREVA